MFYLQVMQIVRPRERSTRSRVMVSGCLRKTAGFLSERFLERLATRL
jgi:hypothetical protein